MSPSLCAAFSLCKPYALSVSMGRSSVAQPLSGPNLPAWHQQKPSFPFPVVLAEVSGFDLTGPTGSCALFAPMAAVWISPTGRAWEGKVWSQPRESKGGGPEESRGETSRQGGGSPAGKPQASTSTAGGRRIWSSAPHGGSGLSDALCLAVIPALPGDLLCAGVCPVRDFYSGVCKPRNCMNTLYLPYGEGILPSPQDP